jgi:hypothetical protein
LQDTGREGQERGRERERERGRESVENFVDEELAATRGTATAAGATTAGATTAGAMTEKNNGEEEQLCFALTEGK